MRLIFGLANIQPYLRNREIIVKQESIAGLQQERRDYYKFLLKNKIDNKVNKGF